MNDKTGECPRKMKGENTMHPFISVTFDRITVEGQVPSFPFPDISSALRFLKKNEGKWFVKVSGEGTELDTYEAPNSEFMIKYLEWVHQRQAEGAV